eukprot:865058-Pelagomonas_calceolata.AAC.11
MRVRRVAVSHAPARTFAKQTNETYLGTVEQTEQPNYLAEGQNPLYPILDPISYSLIDSRIRLSDTRTPAQSTTHHCQNRSSIQA